MYAKKSYLFTLKSMIILVLSFDLSNILFQQTLCCTVGAPVFILFLPFRRPFLNKEF